MASGIQGSTGAERSVLRWGGLAGILGSLVFIFVPVILFGFVPQAPAGTFRMEGGGQVDPAALVMMFPDARAPIAVANFLNFVSAVLTLALVLALYQALRRTSLAPALLGSVLYVLGLGVLFTESVTQVAFDPISSLYHTPGVTPAEQATLALLWQATQGIFFELDAAAILLLSVAMVVLGVAMLKAPNFGKRVGTLVSVLGGEALFVTSVFGVTSFLVALLLIPVFVVIPIALGWKVYSMSKVA
jgi:hypothetical protein